MTRGTKTKQKSQHVRQPAAGQTRPAPPPPCTPRWPGSGQLQERELSMELLTQARAPSPPACPVHGLPVEGTLPAAQPLQGGQCSHSDRMMTPRPRPGPLPRTHTQHHGLLDISEDANRTLNHSMSRTRTKTSSASNGLPPLDEDPTFLAAQDKTLLHPQSLPFPHPPHPTCQVLLALPQQPPF